MVNYICPIDKLDLQVKEFGFVSSSGIEYKTVNIDGTEVFDFRCLDLTSSVSLEFQLPVDIISEIDGWKNFGKATEANFKSLSREQFRKRFGTKLQKEVAYYLDFLFIKKGKTARILDLGCGDGATRNFLNSIGFEDVTCVDWYHKNADALVDVHRLPYKSGTFDLILTTACLEHFYNPFVAFSEMSRVLTEDGMLIASGSFWESWHGDSCFHSTPAGLKILCQSADLELEDVWSGWGFLPSIASHAFGLSKFKRITYFLQRVFDLLVREIAGKDAVKKHKFRTSGSFGIFAVKNGGQ